MIKGGMRNILPVSAVIIALLFAACKKTKIAPASGTITANVISPKLGLKAWTSAEVITTLTKLPGIQITIDADSANTHLQLHIANYMGAGTYKMTDSTNKAYYTSYNKVTGSLIHYSKQGQIVVINAASSGNTQDDIKGTFTFFTDSVTVSNGTFDVQLNLD